MKIFVTGASGFIGRNLLPVLDEHDLLCLSNSKQIKSTTSNVKVFNGDLNNLDTYIDELTQFKPDCCIHLAWQGLPDYSIRNSVSNLNAGIQLVESLVKVECKKIFIAGSCWEYGELEGLVDENSNPIDTGIFASFKSSLRIITESICNGSNTKLIWGRVFFVYGPDQREKALIPTCFRDFKSGFQPQINNPKARNDFVYVGDVVNCIKVLVESQKSNGLYNIGSGESSAVWEVVNMVANEMRVPLPYKDIPSSLNGCFADISKIKKHGWIPKVSLVSGLSKTVKYLNKNDDQTQTSSNFLRRTRN